MLKVATVLPHEPYREYKDVERVYSGSTEIDKILDKNGNVLFAVNKEVEGTPVLTYKGKEETNLKNYRIYGQTVDGESVGDRTGNLFDGYVEIGSFDLHGADVNNKDALAMCRTGYINVLPDTTYTISLNGDYIIRHVGYYGGDFTYIGSLSVSVCTFTTPSATNQIRIVFKTVSGDSANVDDFTNIPIMLNSGSTPLPYEPYGYKVPVTVTNGTDTVTTPIYLPEPIKMVGNEAEYIDYKEQKQHRVRKNLLPNNGTSYIASVITATKNDDGSVTISNHGEEGVQVTWVYYNSDDVLFKAGTQIIISTRYTASISFKYSDNTWSGSISQNQVYTIPKDIIMAYTQFYINADEIHTLYPMIRKADIEDDTYEPYIKNVDLDVTLPALPTLAGTNTLTIGTEVQPSNVYLKGRIKEIA